MRAWLLRLDLGGARVPLGATVADFWGERGLAPNVRIATEVDSGRFFEMLYALLRD